MKSLNALTLAVLLSACLATAATAQTGTYRFGDAVLDLGRHSERTSLGEAPVKICSNERYYCVGGVLFHVVIPRNCYEPIPPPWEADGIVTEVLASVRVPNRVVPNAVDQDLLLLGSQSHPSVVYLYERTSGITQVYYDPQMKADVVGLAKAGALRALSESKSLAGGRIDADGPLMTCKIPDRDSRRRLSPFRRPRALSPSITAPQTSNLPGLDLGSEPVARR